MLQQRAALVEGVLFMYMSMKDDGDEINGNVPLIKSVLYISYQGSKPSLLCAWVCLCPF